MKAVWKPHHNDGDGNTTCTLSETTTLSHMAQGLMWGVVSELVWEPVGAQLRPPWFSSVAKPFYFPMTVNDL